MRPCVSSVLPRERKYVHVPQVCAAGRNYVELRQVSSRAGRVRGLPSPSARAHIALTTTVYLRSVPIKRYSPNEAPNSIIPDIIKALAA